MGLFGITLKKLENIPSDLWHDAFGGGNNGGNSPAPNNSGPTQLPQQNGNFRAPPAQNGGLPQPNMSLILNPPPLLGGKKNTNTPGMLPNNPANTNPATEVAGVGAGVALGTLRAGEGLVQGALATPDMAAHAGNWLLNKASGTNTTPPFLMGLDSATSKVSAPINFLAKKTDQAADAFGGSAQTVYQPAQVAANVATALPAAAALATKVPVVGSKAMAAADFINAQRNSATLSKLPVVGDAFDHPAPSEIQAAKQAPQPTPNSKPMNIKPTAASTLKTSEALPQNTANAAHTLDALYNEEAPVAENGNNLLNMAAGRQVRFSKAGDQLEEAINKDYTPEEQLAARDNLENVASKLGATPKVQALTDVKRQLNEKGYGVLDKNTTAEEPLHRVQNYATRVVNSGKSLVSSIRNGDIQDLLNTKSGHQINRAVQKFVSSKGDVKYGSQTELGLTKKDGNLVDNQGTHFKPVSTSTSELNANGFNYEDNLGKIANKYHSSVGRVKAALDAKSELIRDPEHYGLTKDPGRDSLNRFTPVRGVPELDGYYAPRKLANKIDSNLGHPYVPSIPEKALQGVTRGAVQSIVLNPLFHGRNLNELAGLAAGKVKGVFGAAQLKKAYVDVAGMSKEERAALADSALRDGVVKQTYGANQQTVLSSALDAAHVRHINKASATVMGNLDWNMRLSLYHLVTNGKNALKGEDAAALINHFLGDAESSGPLARNIGLFWHYMKTRVGVVADAIAHPRENAGAILTGAEQAAVLYGATKAFQEWTGNQHASLGHPGLGGLVNTADEVAHGHAATAATSSINPVFTAIGNQLWGKDLFTGKDFTSNKDRAGNALHTLVAPTQNTSKVSDGKATVGQVGLQMGLGINLPHVKGAPAIPNEYNPLAIAVNTKDAKPVADEKNSQGQVAVHDPTGLDQAKLYYNAKNTALKAVAGNPKATDAINLFLDSNITANGEKMKNSPAQTMGAAEALSGSPDAMAAMKKLQQAQPSHDPIWDLSDKDLKTFLQSEGSSSSSGVKEADKIIHTDFNNGQGFDQFLKQRDAYYSNNKFESTSKDNPETPNFPSFQGQQQADYNTYKAQFQNATGQQKAQFLEAHPLAADAIKQVGDYYNALNKAQTGLMTKDSMQLSPAQQTWFNWYNSLPKGSGARSQAIKGDPAMWKSISGALAENDLTNLAKEGAVNQYQGVPFQQNFLKNALNAGKYDVQSNVPLPGGGTGYAVNTSGASSSSGNGKGGKGSSKASAMLSKVLASEKQASAGRDAEHAAKAAKRAFNPYASQRAPRRLSVKIKGTPTGKPPRAKQAGVGKVYIPSIKLRSPSNKATLKVR